MIVPKFRGRLGIVSQDGNGMMVGVFVSCTNAQYRVWGRESRMSAYEEQRGREDQRDTKHMNAHVHTIVVKGAILGFVSI